MVGSVSAIERPSRFWAAARLSSPKSGPPVIASSVLARLGNVSCHWRADRTTWQKACLFVAVIHSYEPIFAVAEQVEPVRPPFAFVPGDRHVSPASALGLAADRRRLARRNRLVGQSGGRGGDADAGRRRIDGDPKRRRDRPSRLDETARGRRQGACPVRPHSARGDRAGGSCGLRRRPAAISAAGRAARVSRAANEDVRLHGFFCICPLPQSHRLFAGRDDRRDLEWVPR